MRRKRREDEGRENVMTATKSSRVEVRLSSNSVTIPKKTTKMNGQSQAAEKYVNGKEAQYAAAKSQTSSPAAGRLRFQERTWLQWISGSQALV